MISNFLLLISIFEIFGLLLSFNFFTFFLSFSFFCSLFCNFFCWFLWRNIHRLFLLLLICWHMLRSYRLWLNNRFSLNCWLLRCYWSWCRNWFWLLLLLTSLIMKVIWWLCRVGWSHRFCLWSWILFWNLIWLLWRLRFSYFNRFRHWNRCYLLWSLWNLFLRWNRVEIFVMISILIKDLLFMKNCVWKFLVHNWLW